LELFVEELDDEDEENKLIISETPTSPLLLLYDLTSISLLLLFVEDSFRGDGDEDFL
jgi:hypothetical protein